MNWVDIIIVSILLFTTIKGLYSGLVLSIFNIVKIILSVILTKRYYPYTYGYMSNNPTFNKLFNNMVQFILKTLFHTKSKNDIDFIPDLISKGLVNIVIRFFSIILIFLLVNILISIILELFSFLLKAPVLKQLDRIGGFIFGLIKGLFIIYLIGLILMPISSIFPKSFIGKGLLSSEIFNYIIEINANSNI